VGLQIYGEVFGDLGGVDLPCTVQKTVVPGLAHRALADVAVLLAGWLNCLR
jgi:hypothetical protein